MSMQRQITIFFFFLTVCEGKRNDRTTHQIWSSLSFHQACSPEVRLRFTGLAADACTVTGPLLFHHKLSFYIHKVALQHWSCLRLLYNIYQSSCLWLLDVRIKSWAASHYWKQTWTQHVLSVALECHRFNDCFPTFPWCISFRIQNHQEIWAAEGQGSER